MSDSMREFAKMARDLERGSKSLSKVPGHVERGVDGVAGVVGAVGGFGDRANGERQERRGYGNATEGRANQAEIYRRQTEQELRGYQRQDESRQQHGPEQRRDGVYQEQGGALVDSDRYAQAAPAPRAPRSPEQLRSDFVDAIAHATATGSARSLEMAREIGEQFRNPATGKIEIPVGREAVGREAIPGLRGTPPALNFTQFNSTFDSVDQAIQKLSTEISKSRKVDAPPIDLNSPMPARQPVVYRPGQEPQTLPTAPAVDSDHAKGVKDVIEAVAAAKAENKGPEYMAALKARLEAIAAESPDGKIHMPRGTVETGQVNAKGDKAIKVSFDGDALTPAAAMKMIEARLAAQGLGQVAQAPAAPAAPATDAPGRTTPAVAPAAPPVTTQGPAPAATELPAADLRSTAPKAKSYNVPSDQMPDGLKQNQVQALQAMLEKAGASTGATPSDGKYGPKTHAALQAACARAGVDFKAVNFADPNDPELKKLTATLNEEARATPGRQAEAPAQAPAQPAPAPAAPAPDAPVLVAGRAAFTGSPGSFAAGMGSAGSSQFFGSLPFSAETATFSQTAGVTMQPVALQQGPAHDAMQAAIQQAQQSSLSASISGGQSADGAQAGTVGGVQRQSGGVTV